ncbi:hypothetical protein CDAR_510381 [Caerostris darwini]|uniref:Uncharacterized protein n=1 Tax=Caerostris darwini TaxID=1538125 RepID=A0AAV4UZ97_9ARAC|nr:hypothetical protein CDAR_510381 [Caerostris darwini]
MAIHLTKYELEDSTDSEEEFNDGYDENLMGGDEDKIRLMQLTEREREQELFYRYERRECLKISSLCTYIFNLEY